LSKSIFYSLEAVISTIMVLSILYLITRNPPTMQEFSKVNYKLKVHKALETLDNIGKLRYYALTNNSETIKNEIKAMIPEIDLFVVIYDDVNLTEEFNPPIYLRNIVSVSYYISGDIETYSPREIRVYIWGTE